MDWTQGYASRWRVHRVDKRTWEPTGELPGVESIEIDRDGTDSAPLLETATLAATIPALDAFASGWHRVVLEATQGMVTERVDVATLWLDEESGEYDRGYRTAKLAGKSALWQAAATPIGDGAYAPKGADGAAWAADQLRGCIDAPVSVLGGFELPGNIVFDLGASVLQAVWAVLKPNGWMLRIDGRGEVHVEPMPTAPALVLDRTGACVLMPTVSVQDGTRTYTREWAPDVHPLALVSCALPERGLDGLCRVRAQKIECTHGLSVQETVEVVG